MRQIDVHKLSDEAEFNGFHGLVLFWGALIIIIVSPLGLAAGEVVEQASPMPTPIDPRA